MLSSRALIPDQNPLSVCHHFSDQLSLKPSVVDCFVEALLPFPISPSYFSPTTRSSASLLKSLAAPQSGVSQLGLTLAVLSFHCRCLNLVFPTGICHSRGQGIYLLSVSIPTAGSILRGPHSGDTDRKIIQPQATEKCHILGQ